MKHYQWLFAALFAALLSGCGGSSGSSATQDVVPLPDDTAAPIADPSDPDEDDQPPSAQNPVVDDDEGEGAEPPPPTNNQVVVNAGDDQTVDEMEVFTLTGVSQVVGQGDVVIVRVMWRQLSGPLATVLSQPDQNMVSYQAPQVGKGDKELRFQFDVETFDGQVHSDTVTVTVRDVIANPLPVVNAGPDLDVVGGEPFTLVGTAEDDDGIADVRWSPLEPSDTIIIENADTLVARVTVPRTDAPQQYRFQLRAVDTRGGASVDTTTVTALPADTNTRPEVLTMRANPGVATGGEQVSLEAAAFDADGDALQFQWSQSPTDPFPLAIQEANTANAAVIVPAISDPVTLNFTVTVSDGALTDSAHTQLQIVPRSTPKPGIVSCLFNLFQPGCPLQLVGDLIGDGGVLRCQDDPFSLDCPLSVIARVSPPIADCLSSPSASGCGQILGQLADPLFVLRSLPTPELASQCTPAFDEQSYDHYAGVIHGHTGYSDGAIGTRPATAFDRVKRQGLDFMGLSDHSDNARLPLTVTGDCFSEQFIDCLIADSDNPIDSFRKWRATQEQAEAVTDATFTAFRGFEWTSDRFGHLNVFFSDNVINAKTGPGYLVSMGLFWQWFMYPSFLGGGDDGLIVFNHPGREDLIEGVVSNIPGGRDPAFAFNDFDHVPGANMRVVGLEVFGKGSEYDSDGVNGSWLSYALDKGWYVGAVGSEDHHATSWGAPSLPKTVMIARSNTKQDIREAMMARRFYAVAQNFNGLRMDFRIENAPMGARLGRPEGTRLPARYQLWLDGAPFEGRVEVVTRQNTVVQTLNGSSGSFDILAHADEPYYFLRVFNPETGRPVAFSSPIWVEADAPPKPLCRL